MIPPFIHRIGFLEDSHRPPPAPYVTAIPAIKALRAHPIEITSPVVILTGENGTGKSTLLSALAERYRFDHHGGARDADYPQQVYAGNDLAPHLLILRNQQPQNGFYLRAESYEVMLGKTEPQLHSLSHSVRALSHGESVLSLIQDFTAGRGLILCDEPESGLSTIRQMVFLAEVYHSIAAGNQFFLITHSPILMAIPGAQIIEFHDQGWREITWNESENVQAMRDFMATPEETLGELLR
ncbi:hypothetical protein GSS88_11835 [Corynebacterium sp. 3HC-13]|uniref:ATP-binding cassette domain-containing protein n=1 Tax=Corynebacterium poyangense TaxID=2684405 RepID=UPI001CCFF3DC|nr:ATPase [Corynebacterium poyangense]MBZ8178466.1 hypothetical protein [Corynebacterium poyangense]